MTILHEDMATFISCNCNQWQSGKVEVCNLEVEGLSHVTNEKKRKAL